MEEKKLKGHVSRSARANLRFPVSRVERCLREGNYSRRLSSSAPVFLTGVLECLTSSILELAGKEAHNQGKKNIVPEHVIQAIKNNEELLQFFRDNKIEIETPESPGE
ncbi:histone H2A-Bbd type 1 [Psammomys obesus]|uniref:histone H2A-Bbd type 1 n=1 Tax=Psammomys obesus TaxID=48139 RepID=UPI002452BC25|nr:histone H2A-Bbd type 1 [Psammomys obesus]